MKYVNLSYPIRENIIAAKCFKIGSWKINSHQVKISFIHSFIPKWFLDSTDVSKDVIFSNVKDDENKEVEIKNVKIIQTLLLYFALTKLWLKMKKPCKKLLRSRTRVTVYIKPHPQHVFPFHGMMDGEQRWGWCRLHKRNNTSENHYRISSFKPP